MIRAFGLGNALNDLGRQGRTFKIRNMALWRGTCEDRKNVQSAPILLVPSSIEKGPENSLGGAVNASAAWAATRVGNQHSLIGETAVVADWGQAAWTLALWQATTVHASGRE